MTVILKVPAETRSLAGIAPVNWLELTNVVVRFDPLKRTVDPETKFDPLTVRVKAPSPTVLLSGEMLVRW